MENSADAKTSPTLLGRLRLLPHDQAAWEEFLRRYGAAILGWSRQGGLQAADAEDVAQLVLLKLAAAMRTFTYDPSRSFRGWLRTLTRHAWSDFVTARQRGGRGAGGETETHLQTLPARDDLIARLEEQFDREVFEEACSRVRLRVEGDTWEAFRLTAVEDVPTAEAARRLGKQLAAVYKARTRVQKLLQDEVRRLEGDGS